MHDLRQHERVQLTFERVGIIAMLKKTADQYTDGDLVDMFTMAGLWLVLGGPTSVLASGTDLQSALALAHEQSMANRSVQGIVLMPDERIVISPEQIARLWKHFNYQPELAQYAQR